MWLYTWLVLAAIVGPISSSAGCRWRRTLYPVGREWNRGRESCKCIMTPYEGCKTYWGKCTTSSSCQNNNLLNVFFLLDSGSISKCDFYKKIAMVKEIVSAFDVRKTDFSVSIFSDDVNEIIPYTRYPTSYELYRMIDERARGSYRPGGTNTHKAINKLRLHSSLTKTIGFVISDSVSDDRTKTVQEAKLARTTGIAIFAIGVGRKFDRTELKDIASYPDSEFVITVPGYSSDSIRDTVVSKTCKVVKEPPLNTANACGSEGRIYRAGTNWRDSHGADCTCVTKKYGVCDTYWANCTAISHCQQNKEIDMFFVLDSSRSIRVCDFYRQLGFVKEIISTFDMNKTRVSVRTFSNKVHDVVPLGRYSLRALYHKIDLNGKYLEREGATDTHKGIKAMHTEARRSSPSNIKIAFVVTDGRATDGPSTIREAKQAHEMDILMFAIGVGGSVSQTELKVIASDPDREFMFTVGGYSALKSIERAVVNKTCRAVKIWTTPKPTTPKPIGPYSIRQRPKPRKTTTTPHLGPLAPTRGCVVDGHPYSVGDKWGDSDGTCECKKKKYRACNDLIYWAKCSVSRHCQQNKEIDVFFLLDSSSSVWECDFYIQLAFVKEIISRFDMKKTRISIRTFSDRVETVVPLDAYTLDAIYDKIDLLGKYLSGTTATYNAIYKMRQELRSRFRSYTTKIGFVITDGASDDGAKTIREAKGARNDGMKMFAIGVGNQVDRTELKAIASDPDTEFVFTIDNYSALKSIEDTIVDATCRAVRVRTTPKSITTTPMPYTTGCFSDGRVRLSRSTWTDSRGASCECKENRYSNCHYSVYWSKCTMPSHCQQNKQIDLYFLLDSSSSIFECDFYRQLPFVKEVISSFDLKKTRVSIRTYGTSVKNHVPLGRYTLTSLSASIDSIVRHEGEAAYTDIAIKEMRIEAQLHSRSKIKVAFVITDDDSTNGTSTIREAKLARGDDMRIFAIGVGRWRSEPELNAIASDPDRDFVFTVDNYLALRSIERNVVNGACIALKTLTTPKPTTPRTTRPAPAPKPTINVVKPKPKPTTPKPTTQKPTTAMTPKPTTPKPKPTTPKPTKLGPYEMRKTTQKPPPGPLPNASAICTFWGDPHYTSFDGKKFDYQGDCKYVMVKECNNNRFIIEVSQVLTRPGSSVAISKSFTIKVRHPTNNPTNNQFMEYRLHWNQVFYTGTIVRNLPFSNNDVTVTKTGNKISLTLVQQSITLTWENNHRATVRAYERDWLGRLCGLCGINNKDRSDDFTMPNGQIATSAVEFGDSWRSSAQQPATCVRSTTTGSHCNETNMGEAQTMCGALRQNEFKECTRQMPQLLTELTANCVTEVCDCGVGEREDRKLCMCTTLEELERGCEAAGFDIPDTWRDGHRCAGICMHNGIVREDSTSWWEGSSSCWCERGVVTCSTNPMCTFWGDPHYTSFDGRKFDYQGDCKYVMVKECNNSRFIIEVSQVLTRPGSSVAISKSITIKVRNPTNNQFMEYHLHWNQVFYVGTNPTSTPYSDTFVNVATNNAAIRVKLFGNKVLLRWENNHRASVMVHHSFVGKLCGLCGPNNNNAQDDFTNPNGVVLGSASAFGDSWITPGGAGGCSPTAITTHPCAGLTTAQRTTISNMCGKIRTREFQKCAGNIDIDRYIVNCQTELCNCGPVPNQLCMCTTLEMVESVCEQAGHAIKGTWRKSFQCTGFCMRDGNIVAYDSTWADETGRMCICRDSIIKCYGSACAKCKKLKGVDIFFIMANSISTDKNDFAKQLAFVKKVTSRFHVPCTRVSVTVANDTGPPVRPLDCVCNIEHIFSSNTNGPNVTIGQFGGKVSTGEAIASMRREARDNKGENRSMIAVVITDGVSRDEIRTREESEMVRDESKMAQEEDGCVMYVIGVGQKTNRRELGHIASDPVGDHVFEVENYSALDNIVHMVAKKAGVDLTAGGAVGRK